MSYVTKEDLNRIVRRLTLACDRKFELDWDYGKPCMVESDSFRKVSPRLPKGQLYVWLVAFESGVEYATK